MILSATLFLLAVICYSIRDLKSFGKLKWISANPYGFIGEHSDKRKYKRSETIAPLNRYDMFEPLDNWYYKFFKIPHREKWFTSATLTVALTDGAHLCQFFFKLLFCAAFYPLTNWWFSVILWLLWTIVWNLCDKYLTK